MTCEYGVMGLEDILKSGDGERLRVMHERRRLQMELAPACEELYSVAKAEVKRALAAVPGLRSTGEASTGLPPPVTETAARRSFALIARSENDKLEVLVSGSVGVEIRDGHLVFERMPLNVAVQRLDLNGSKIGKGDVLGRWQLHGKDLCRERRVVPAID